MAKILLFFERYTILLLMSMMMLVVLLATIELGIQLVQEIRGHPRFLLNISDLLEIFGFFFMILIGLELVDTIKSYLTEERMHVEIVFLVAMIAIARKVIILDLKTLSSFMLLGMAAIIIALSAGYFLVKQAHRQRSPRNPRNVHE